MKGFYFERGARDDQAPLTRDFAYLHPPLSVLASNMPVFATAPFVLPRQTAWANSRSGSTS